MKRSTGSEHVPPHENEANSRVHWPVGHVIGGKWRIDGLIGSGGMGSVFAAQHRNGKRVALKVLHRQLLANPRFKTRFLREGYLANRVEHPDVVSVLDDGETDEGDVFLVMELLVGETLECRRKEAALSLDSALDIADQVLDVLASAHAKGIVHRDIKPANLFLTEDDVVKVLDFGVASLRETTVASADEFLGALGVSGGLGTPSFMAPEQARGCKAHVDQRADLWSLGAVLFTLLTGRFVHETETARDALIAAAMTRPLLVRALRPDLPQDVAAIVDRALAFESWERWSDARTMQAAVRDCRLKHSERGTLGDSLVGTSRSLSEQPTATTELTPSSRPARKTPHATRAEKKTMLGVTLGTVFAFCIAGVGAPFVVRVARTSPDASMPSIAATVPPPADWRSIVRDSSSHEEPHAAPFGESLAASHEPAHPPSSRAPRAAPSPRKNIRSAPLPTASGTAATTVSASGDLWRVDESWLERRD